MNRYALLLLALIGSTVLLGAAPLGAQQLAAMPTIFDISPSQVDNNQDSAITIVGVGFVDPPVVTLSVCGLKPILLKEIRLENATTIKASVPQGTPEGAYQLTVYNPDGAASAGANMTLTVVRPGDQWTSSWHATTPLENSRYDFATVAVASNLYLIGGYSGGSLGDGLRSVQRAVIGTDGALGRWQATSTLINGRGSLAAAATDEYLYAIGGATAPGIPTERSVERARITPDGSLGEWIPVTPLPEIRFHLAATRVGDYLLVMDGWASWGGEYTPADTLQAHIDADGSIGAWQPAPGTSGKTRQAVAAGNAVFALNDDGSIERTTLRDDGSIAAWQPVPATAIPHVSGALAVMAERLYVLGGARGGQECPIALNAVEGATINADGSLGPWEAAPSLQTGRYPLGAAGWGHQIYAVGGEEVWNTQYNLRAGRSIEVATDRALTERLYLPLLADPRP